MNLCIIHVMQVLYVWLVVNCPLCLIVILNYLNKSRNIHHIFLLTSCQWIWRSLRNSMRQRCPRSRSFSFSSHLLPPYLHPQYMETSMYIAIPKSQFFKNPSRVKDFLHRRGNDAPPLMVILLSWWGWCWVQPIWMSSNPLVWVQIQ